MSSVTSRWRTGQISCSHVCLRIGFGTDINGLTRSSNPRREREEVAPDSQASRHVGELAVWFAQLSSRRLVQIAVGPRRETES